MNQLSEVSNSSGFGVEIQRYIASSTASRRAAEVIVDRAEIKAGEHILEIGTGSGILTTAIAERLRQLSGRFYSLDDSRVNLERVRRQLGEETTFIQAPIGRMAHLFNQPMDLVIVNGIDGRAKDLEQLMIAGSSAIHETGRIVVGLPGLFVRSHEAIRLTDNPFIPVVFKMAQTQYPEKTGKEVITSPAITIDQLKNMLDRSHLRYRDGETLWFREDLKSYYRLLQIPEVNQRLLPGMGSADRAKCINLAYNLMPINILIPLNFFVFRACA